MSIINDVELKNFLTAFYITLQHIQNFKPIWENACERLARRANSKDVETLIDAYKNLSRFFTMNAILYTSQNEKTDMRRKWTPEEDETLLAWATDDNPIPLTHLSLTMHRSPQSITTRLSNILGVERKSKPVHGRFEGMMEGQEIEAHVTGRVWKERGDTK